MRFPSFQTISALTYPCQPVRGWWALRHVGENPVFPPPHVPSKTAFFNKAFSSALTRRSWLACLVTHAINIYYPPHT